MNVSTGFFILLILVVSALSLALVWPFIQYILIAILLAYVLYPLQRKLSRRIGSKVSAFVLVFLATFSVIIPFIMMLTFIASDAIAFVQNIDPEAIPIERIEFFIEDRAGVSVDIITIIQSSVENVVQLLLGSATDLFGAFVHVLIGIALAAFLLFFLLHDGNKLLLWIRNITPLPEPVQSDLFEGFDRLMWAVLVGHLVVAIIQGTLAGIGLWSTGVPNAMFWTLVMIILALIPLIGTFLVWAPAAGWLLLTGSPFGGIALFIYGLIVVGTSDEFLRPLIVGQVDVNPSIVIVGVIGGMFLFGFVGLFFGPIIVGSFKVILEVFDEHYEDLA